MRIQRKAIGEAVLPNIFLLEHEHERFLLWEKLVFWDGEDHMRDDFPARIPLSILLVVFVIAASLFLLYQAYGYQIFASQGIPATETLTHRDTSSFRNLRYYYLHYSYVYAAGDYTINVEVPKASYESAIIGSSRVVLIVPAKREWVIESMNEVLLPLLLAFAVFVLAIGLNIYYFYRCYRPILLLPATITEVEQSEKHSNRGVHAIYEIQYELTSPKTKKPLKARTSIPAKQIAPTTEQLLAVLYVKDEDIIPL